MLLKKDKNIEEFIHICYFLRYKVDYYNNDSKFDINKDLEEVGIILFKHIYNYELRDLNKEVKNFPAVDLGEETKFVGIQVTSTDKTSKVKSTIEKFFRHNLNERFRNGLKVFIFSFSEENNLQSYVSKMLNDKKNAFGEDFVEVLYLNDIVNRFRKMNNIYQADCLIEMREKVLIPIINSINIDEDFIMHKSVNAKKIEKYYDEDCNILVDLEAIQNKLSLLSFETRVLLYDLIYLGHSTGDLDDSKLYLFDNVGVKIVKSELTGNFEELIFHKFIKVKEELYTGDYDFPQRVAVLKMPVKNKDRYFGWSHLRDIHQNLLLREELLRMIHFLDFRVFDN